MCLRTRCLLNRRKLVNKLWANNLFTSSNRRLLLCAEVLCLSKEWVRAVEVCRSWREKLLAIEASNLPSLRRPRNTRIIHYIEERYRQDRNFTMVGIEV